MAIQTGDYVAYRGGNTRWVAIETGPYFARKYTLVSQRTGRKRYNVPERELSLWSERQVVELPVKTTKGWVSRPKGWRGFDNFAGGARRTWIGKKWVFKKGHSSWGESRCALEACRYFLQSGGNEDDAVAKFGAQIVKEARYYAEVPVAECYLLSDGTLMMERVLPIRSLQAGSGAPTMDPAEREKRGFSFGGHAWPKWSQYIDSGQIGLTDKGELVAYDL